MDKKSSRQASKPTRVMSDIRPRPQKKVTATKPIQSVKRGRPQVLDLRKSSVTNSSSKSTGIRVKVQSSNSVRTPSTNTTLTAQPRPAAKTSSATSKETGKKAVRVNQTQLDKNLNSLRKRFDKINNRVIKHIQRFVVNRWDHIKLARSSVIGWLVIMLVLISAGLVQILWYNSQTAVTVATSGGTYAEGVVDRLTTISPLYASTDAEKAASQLVYPGLLTYDETGNLQADLATAWSHDITGKIWTVKLRPSLTWSDGKPLTASDVAYTVKLMKNKDISQVLANNWSTITAEVKSTDEVEFKLENAYMSFPTALTFGIVPEHILSNKTPVEISSLFASNTAVPGAGPFKLRNVENSSDTQSIWHFTPNQQYYAQQPRLDEITLRTYTDQSSLVNGLKRGEVNAISNVNISDLKQFDSKQYRVIQLKTSDGVYALFNNDSAIMTSQVRNALRLATNRSIIRQSVTGSNKALDTPTALETPIATSVYQSIDQLKQPDYNQQLAAQTLEQAGWKLTPGSSLRQQNGQTLDINIVTIKGTNYSTITQQIADQLQKIGVNAKVTAINPAEAQQNYLMPRNYDVLVYQMHLGADPDEYAYWSSTQTGETGLNFANYTSRRAEIALSAGRTNPNAQAREARYLAFVEQWLRDAPAIALYQPNYYYVTTKNISSWQNNGTLNDATDRFYGINNWTVNTATVRNTP